MRDKHIIAPTSGRINSHTPQNSSRDFSDTVKWGWTKKRRIRIGAICDAFCGPGQEYGSRFSVNQLPYFYGMPCFPQRGFTHSRPAEGLRPGLALGRGGNVLAVVGVADDHGRGQRIVRPKKKSREDFWRARADSTDMTIWHFCFWRFSKKRKIMEGRRIAPAGNCQGGIDLAAGNLLQYPQIHYPKE